MFQIEHEYCKLQNQIFIVFIIFHFTSKWHVPNFEMSKFVFVFNKIFKFQLVDQIFSIKSQLNAAMFRTEICKFFTNRFGQK